MSAFAEVLETPELVQLIVSGLQLADVALVALQVNRSFREAARGRVTTLWPKVSPLLAAPFNLKRHDLLGMDHLDLGFKKIGGADCTALAEACAIGALPALATLALDDNQISDGGLIALADSFAKGALPALATLDLNVNQIGDEGMMALADACAKEGLAQCHRLELWSNKIGDQGMAVLADALDKGALPALVDFYIFKKAPALNAACEKRGITYH